MRVVHGIACVNFEDVSFYVNTRTLSEYNFFLFKKTKSILIKLPKHYDGNNFRDLFEIPGKN